MKVLNFSKIFLVYFHIFNNFNARFLKIHPNFRASPNSKILSRPSKNGPHTYIFGGPCMHCSYIHIKLVSHKFFMGSDVHQGKAYKRVYPLSVWGAECSRMHRRLEGRTRELPSPKQEKNCCRNLMLFSIALFLATTFQK